MTLSWFKSGEAFKEAHGGGTLFGFVAMLVSATMMKYTEQ
jgi:hypothetical protein